MTTRVVATEADRQGLFRLLQAREKPFTVEIVKGRRRSVDQNRMQRRLLSEIAEQTGQTAEEVRAYCKLTIGVPILRAENELFCLKYDEIIRPLPYETKLAMMAEPFDFPITRLMTTAQKTRYLDEIQRHFGGQGVVFHESDPTAGLS
jgi:hypothetical protein